MSEDNSRSSQGQAPETPEGAEGQAAGAPESVGGQAAGAPESVGGRAARDHVIGARLKTGLLADQVVVVSGVGPGLGRSICLEAAAAGAKVVLAARTESRLKEVAAEIEAEGGETLCVATDITDDEAVRNLVARTLETFGRVDALVNNAFAVPSMKPLARTDYQQIRDSIDLTVLGGLRMTQAFTEALTETKGSVVMINSAVLRHSEPRYGSYKVAKSALLAMSQTLATELGPKGVRVNTVAPGYIWTDQLKWYFGEIAKKYNITPEQVYEQTAARSDLKRLPEPDEIARAVVFLASPWANAITGQTLDVNCGEYHV
ncbi:SDR family oxidoreductase [Nocardia sp. IFM 10818]